MVQRKNSKQRTTKAVKSAEAVRLRVDGLTQADIARTLKVSQATVSRYLTEAQNDLREQRTDDADLIRQRELAELDWVAEQAKAEWDRYAGSFKAHVLTHGGNSGSYIETGPEPIGAKGAALLRVVLDCSASRRRLLGLDAPELTKAVPVGLDDLTADEAQAIVAEFEGAINV